MAKAKEIAGDKDVGVNGGQMARQALEAGLFDEIGVELVPVILGAGTPLFADFDSRPVEFDGPIKVVEGTGGHPPPLPGDQVGGHVRAIGGVLMNELSTGSTHGGSTSMTQQVAGTAEHPGP